MKPLLDKFNDKELKLLDTLIDKKGSAITVSLASNTVSDMSNEPNNYFISATYGSHEEVATSNRKIIFINDSFEFQEVNIFALLNESNSFNNIIGLISGEKIPKNSTISFGEFPKLKLIVDKVGQIRPMSLVFRYTLSRA